MTFGPLLVVSPAVECSKHGWVGVWSLREWARGCPRCRREREQARAKRTAEVRNPPRYKARPGCCSLCGVSPLPPRCRTWCHDCPPLWAIATSSDAARRHLVGLHGPSCWECGTAWRPGVDLERDWSDYSYRDGPAPPLYGPPTPLPVALAVDHVRPLWSLTDDERQELRWWLPFNLQLLCDECHKAKTKAEAGQRAALRRTLQT